MVRFVASVAVLAACTFLVADGQAAAKKKKRGKHGVTAKVLSIDLAKDSKDEGTLTVKVVHRRKKKNATTEAKEIKIEIKKDTKIERAGNRKKKEPPTSAVFADLQTDQVITFRLREGTDGKVADQVVIRRAKKKKDVQ
jgi:hypothetical protein